MVWLTDPHGSCTFLNRRWYDFTGQSAETGLGAGWLDVIHPDDRALAFEALGAGNEKREPFRLESRFRSAEGACRWAIISAAPRFAPEGEFVGFIATAIDIHDRKDTDERLRASEERYRHLFESIDEGFCVIEMVFDNKGRPADYRWLETNPSFEQQTGLVNAIGKTARQLVPNLDESWFRIYGRVALTGEPIRFENHAPAMNRWFDVFAFRVDRPEQGRVALLFNEISERKIRELNAILLADVGADFARATGAREIMALVGEKLCRHLHAGSAAFAEVDDAGEFATVVHQRKERGVPSFSGVHRLADLMSDTFRGELEAGRTVAVADIATDPRTAGKIDAYQSLGVSSQIQAPYLSEGRWRFMLGVYCKEPRAWRASEVDLMRELSARVWLRLERARAEESLRESERNLRRLSRSLEQRVAERTAELQEQAARLRRMAADLASAEQRERKRLAALLHDDLQQLLVAASMHLNNARRRMKDAHESQAVEQASRWIAEATNAARDLTRQLRPPALYEDGLVAALHGLAVEMAERHDLRVTITDGEAATRISDDVKALLFESIRELLFNAAKHARVKNVSVRIWEEGGCLRVVVEDYGQGFDVAGEGHHRSRRGFGLFSIRERLAAVGGKTSITSEIGRGTRVALELPLLVEGPEEKGRLREAARSEPGASAPSPGNGTDGRIRVMVVDDHTMVRHGLATLLDEDERLVVVSEAPDGMAAIDAVEQHRPDVVLIDVNMPRMNGIEATREIHRRWPGTIIVGLSVQDDDTTAKAMRDAGASLFLSKGGDSDRLIAAVVELTKRTTGRA